MLADILPNNLMNFNFNEIVRLREINKIFESEISILEQTIPNLFIPEIDNTIFLKSREDYLFRFQKFKYLIFTVVDDSFSTNFEDKLNDWKSKICDENNGKKNYYFDLYSLNNFILGCLTGKYQTKSNRILWAYLEEFGNNEGYEKIKEILPYIEDTEIENDFKNNLKQYDTLKNEQEYLLEIINSKDYLQLFSNWLNKKNDESVLNAAIDFLSFQKFDEEKKDIDLLTDNVFDRIEEIKNVS